MWRILLPVSGLAAIETVVQEDLLLGYWWVFASCVSTDRPRECSDMNPLSMAPLLFPFTLIVSCVHLPGAEPLHDRPCLEYIFSSFHEG